MQRLINLCYCTSFWKNNNLKVYFDKQTKSNLFIRTSKHAANASPPNQNKVLQQNYVSADQCVILKHLLQLVLLTFV